MSNIMRAAGVAAVVLSGLLAASAANAASHDRHRQRRRRRRRASTIRHRPRPVGGNTGTTLGQQRLIAFQAVANKWGATLTSTVTIRVLATFEPLTCTATSGRARIGRRHFQYAVTLRRALANTWYSKALANKLVGPGARCCQQRGHSARASTAIWDKPDCLDGRPFYLGLDNNHGTLIDLVTVLTHEFGHGLGFQTFTSGSTGAQLVGLPSTWDHLMRDTTQNLRWTEMTNAQRVRVGHQQPQAGLDRRECHVGGARCV
jgi:hypothetical protein